MTPRMKEKYWQEVVPELREEFGYGNPMQVPRVLKMTVNMGVGEAAQDAKLLEEASKQLGQITGQKPEVRRARKSIANFKIRAGMPVGLRVTLRGDRMWEMLDRLISIALPRIRDFRGISGIAFDGQGNYNLGLREQIIFPEIDYDKIDRVRGLDISITTSAQTDEEGRALLAKLGMPFTR
jgi:large subunit ribosomal protein L5